MIKVYVYVVGLALYQLTDGTSPAARILFPAGGLKSEILGAEIPSHKLIGAVLMPGGGSKAIETNAFRLAAACPEGACGPIGTPAHIPDLDRITGLSTQVKSGFQGLAAAKASGGIVAGTVELGGAWTMEAAVSCADPRVTLPAPPKDDVFAMKLNFVEAKAPWIGRYANAPDLPAYGNAVRLQGQVATVAELTDDAALRQALGSGLLGAKECRKRTGLKAPNGCIVVVLDNGSGHEPGHTMASTGGDLLGRADAHFAALYHLLEEYPRQVYLPVVAEGRLCPKPTGAGTPGSQCVGGVVKAKADKK